MIGLRQGVTEGAAIGRFDREVAISEARSAGFGAGRDWAHRTRPDELQQAMWIGAMAALVGVFVGAMIRAWLDERRSDAEFVKDGGELAAPLSGSLVTDAAGELDPAPAEAGA